MYTNDCTGHNQEAWARMNFVVRYHPQEQDRLVAHHDSSTFTFTVSLSRRVRDAHSTAPLRVLHASSFSHYTLRAHCNYRDL